MELLLEALGGPLLEACPLRLLRVARQQQKQVALRLVAHMGWLQLVDPPLVASPFLAGGCNEAQGKRRSAQSFAAAQALR